MSNVRDVVVAIGAPQICERLDVAPGSVRSAVIAGKFPARWYAAMLPLAAEYGTTVRLDMFAMRPLLKRSARSPEPAEA